MSWWRNEYTHDSDEEEDEDATYHVENENDYEERKNVPRQKAPRRSGRPSRRTFVHLIRATNLPPTRGNACDRLMSQGRVKGID